MQRHGGVVLITHLQDDAYQIALSSGKSSALCDANSSFMKAYANCESCVAANNSTSSDDDVLLGQFADYCVAETATAEGRIATATGTTEESAISSGSISTNLSDTSGGLREMTLDGVPLYQTTGTFSLDNGTLVTMAIWVSASEEATTTDASRTTSFATLPSRSVPKPTESTTSTVIPTSNAGRIGLFLL